MTTKLPYYDLHWVRAANDTRSEGMLKAARKITFCYYHSIPSSIFSFASLFPKKKDSNQNEGKQGGSTARIGNEPEKEERNTHIHLISFFGCSN